MLKQHPCHHHHLCQMIQYNSTKIIQMIDFKDGLRHLMVLHQELLNTNPAIKMVLLIIRIQVEDREVRITSTTEGSLNNSNRMSHLGLLN